MGILLNNSLRVQTKKVSQQLRLRPKRMKNVCLKQQMLSLNRSLNTKHNTAQLLFFNFFSNWFEFFFQFFFLLILWHTKKTLEFFFRYEWIWIYYFFFFQNLFQLFCITPFHMIIWSDTSDIPLSDFTKHDPTVFFWLQRRITRNT